MAALISEIVDITIKKIDEDCTIKTKQLVAIKHVINGHDALAILPTSYGKSFLFLNFSFCPLFLRFILSL
jgi:Superfamily II DNA helicase